VVDGHSETAAQVESAIAGHSLLLVGDIAYTAGVAINAAERIPYCHLMWHLFVGIGTTYAA
jgi:predicted membrane channel-forming protein YqfA (hemolysin III family)